jgi:hypothetical protein
MKRSYRDAIIAGDARKPYADRLSQIALALHRAQQHQPIDPSYAEGWHAALSILREALNGNIMLPGDKQ